MQAKRMQLGNVGIYQRQFKGTSKYGHVFWVRIILSEIAIILKTFLYFVFV